MAVVKLVATLSSYGSRAVVVGGVADRYAGELARAGQSNRRRAGTGSASPQRATRPPLWPAGMAEGNRATFGPRVGLSSHGSPAKGGPKSKCLAWVKIAQTSAGPPSLPISDPSRFPVPRPAFPSPLVGNHISPPDVFHHHEPGDPHVQHMFGTSARSDFRRGCGRASWRPPSDLVLHVHVSGALSGACTGKEPQMANPRPTPKPENLRPPWPPGTSGNPAGYSRGRRISDAIERQIDEMALDREFGATAIAMALGKKYMLKHKVKDPETGDDIWVEHKPDIAWFKMILERIEPVAKQTDDGSVLEALADDDDSELPA